MIFSLGNISSKLVGFVLLPIYTDHLSTTEYGILAVLEATSQIMIEVFAFNIPIAMLRWCAQEKDPRRENSIIFTTFFSIFILAGLLTILLYPLSGNFSQIFFSNDKYINYFQWLFILIGTAIINKFPLALTRLREKSILFVSLNLLKLILILVFNIYFVAFLKLGVIGIIYGQIIGQIALFVFSIPITIKNINLKFDLGVLKEMFFYGLPLIFPTVSAMVLTLGDRYILPFLLDYSSLGIYALGYKLASVINVFLLHSFQLGFLPIAFQMLDKPGAKRYFSKTLTYFVFVLTLAFIGLSLFSREVINLLASNKEYLAAYTVVPFVAFAFVLRGIQYVFIMGFHYTKQTKYNAYIVLGGVVIHIALTFLFVPVFSIYGAALAMIISIAVMIVITRHYSMLLYPVPYEIGKIIKMLSIGIMLVGISYLFTEFNIYLRVILKFGLIIIFPIILYFAKFYEKVELDQIQSSWIKWRNPFRWKENVSKIKLK